LIYSKKAQTSELSEFIESIWCYQQESAHDYEHVLPSTTSQLLINLHQNELRHWEKPGTLLRSIGPVGIQGILTKPALIDTEQKNHVCGVAFTAFGLSAFCSIDACQFSDSIVDAFELWGQSTIDLRTNIKQASDPEKQCQLMEEFLAERLIRNTSENELIKKILALLQTGVSLTDIRKEFDLSQRRLHALFDRRIGVRPKSFGRIDRFGVALESLPKNVALSDLASDLGYSDQAHFTREFHAFSGKPPTKYVAVENEIRHAHVASDNFFKITAQD